MQEISFGQYEDVFRSFSSRSNSSSSLLVEDGSLEDSRDDIDAPNARKMNTIDICDHKNSIWIESHPEATRKLPTIREGESGVKNKGDRENKYEIDRVFFNEFEHVFSLAEDNVSVSFAFCCEVSRQIREEPSMTEEVAYLWKMFSDMFATIN